MVIELKKGRDGPPNLACVRADGSRTWSKLHPSFPVHDLTHCAVESIFGFTEAFFGLVASGWGIDDFVRAGAAARLPQQARWAETLVGLFDLERAGGDVMTAARFDEALATALRGQGIAPFRPVGEAELAAVRALRDDLSARWRVLPLGGTLEVPFPALRVASGP
jgi:hypothetical protein